MITLRTLITLLALPGLTAGLLTLSQPVRAAQTGDSVQVTFTGVLKRKPCHINNDQAINIHFGNVGIHKVDGTRYMQPVNYTLQCDEQDPGLTLNLSVRGRRRHGIRPRSGHQSRIWASVFCRTVSR